MNPKVRVTQWNAVYSPWIIKYASLPIWEEIILIKYGWIIFKKIVMTLTKNELTFDIFKKTYKFAKNTMNNNKIIQ